jgi:antitoxin component YwqK of YwqJK toxin-antitoxin module
MKKLSLNLIILTLFATSHIVISSKVNAQTFFDNTFTGKHVEKFADGKTKYEVTIKNGKKEGLEIFYYPSGNKQIQTKITSTLSRRTRTWLIYTVVR